MSATENKNIVSFTIDATPKPDEQKPATVRGVATFSKKSKKDRDKRAFEIIPIIKATYGRDNFKRIISNTLEQLYTHAKNNPKQFGKVPVV